MINVLITYKIIKKNIKKRKFIKFKWIKKKLDEKCDKKKRV